jgi:hypothetical protein
VGSGASKADRASACVSGLQPSIDDIRPLLEHMAALLILGLVVDAAREVPFFVGQAFLDPVAIKTQFVEKRRARPVQIMNGKRPQRRPFIAQV